MSNRPDSCEPATLFRLAALAESRFHAYNHHVLWEDLGPNCRRFWRKRSDRRNVPEMRRIWVL
jgi:hypothetical protein